MPSTPEISTFSGQQFELRHGGYRAVITELGARLRELSHDGRPLVVPFGVDEVPPVYRGAVLAPWPNRVGDGAYTFDGVAHQLPINEVERMTALHGLAAWGAWHLLDASQDDRTTKIALGYRIWPQEGYPFTLDLVIDYQLGDDGLSIELAASNSGPRAAPYGCSIHPYLVAGDGRVDDWALSLPASSYLRVDAERLLPLEVVSVDDGPMDFRASSPIGVRKIDHAFTGLEFDEARECSARAVDSRGRGVEMTWDRACLWAQVHTADQPDPEKDRVGLALEPMTCPPNAFQSGLDLIRLEPGQTTKATWRIRAI